MTIEAKVGGGKVVAVGGEFFVLGAAGKVERHTLERAVVDRSFPDSDGRVFLLSGAHVYRDIWCYASRADADRYRTEMARITGEHAAKYKEV